MQPRSSSQSPATLPLDLREDLLTAWVPEAFHWLGIELFARRQPQQVADGEIEVWTSTGRRSVALTTPEFQEWANRQVNASVHTYEARLSPQVFGYKDALTPYRSAWRELTSRITAERKAGKVIARVDVSSFFRSVSAELCAKTLPPDALGVTRLANDHLGVLLIPGSRWSRRLANLVLSEADARLGDGFVRWQDDYWLIGMTQSGVCASESVLRASLEDIGLELNSSKSFDHSSESTFPPFNELTEDRALVELACSAESGGPLSKYLLRWFTERSNDRALRLVPDLLAAHPVLAPRAAEYVAACHRSALAPGIVRSLSATEDAWVAARIAATASGRSGLAKSIRPSMINLLAAHSARPVRSLAARLQRESGSTVMRVDERTDRLLDQLDENTLAAWAPSAKTTL